MLQIEGPQSLLMLHSNFRSASSSVHLYTFAVALMRIESTLLIGRFIKGCAREIRADLSFVKPDLGCSFALIAHSSTESLILHSTWVCFI